MPRILAVFALALFVATLRTPAATLPAVRVHADGHHLETADGRPFFWLGDTAWSLLHRADRDETSYFLRTRAEQGFTVIQVNALAEMNGVRDPSVLGQKPFHDDDPRRPNDAYFDRLVEVVDEAAQRGLHVALLPAWGDKLTAPWGDGPRLFTADDPSLARAYGEYLGRKLRGRTNVIWMLGGDRPAYLDPNAPKSFPNAPGIAAGFAPNHDWRPVWRAMADGLQAGAGTRLLTLYHPPGGTGTSRHLPDESWLDVHGWQSGHGGGHDVPIWESIALDHARSPAKPTLDLEPNYEDHPVSPWPRWDPARGYFRDHDVRKQCYRSVFAGACGVTYGHHAVWQMAGPRFGSINFADRDWVDALHRPGARQMVHLRRLIESRPFFDRIPDAGLVLTPESDRSRQVVACRDRAATYAFIYIPTAGQSFRVDLGRFAAGQLRVRWYDPRTGASRDADKVAAGQPRDFRSPADGPDWVLVLDREDAGYPAPGF